MIQIKKQNYIFSLRKQAKMEIQQSLKLNQRTIAIIFQFELFCSTNQIEQNFCYRKDYATWANFGET